MFGQKESAIEIMIKELIPSRIKKILRPFYKILIGKSQHSISRNMPMIQIVRRGGFDIAYRKGSADEYVLEHSFDSDIFFSGVPEYQHAGDQLIIDVGAHIGTFSLLASSKVKDGKVFAIEASEESFNMLRINVALNMASNISVHHLALTDHDGTSILYHDDGNWGHSAVKQLSRISETSPSMTLSHFLLMNQINRCHFMKLNCEGSEFPILLSTPFDILQKFDIILTLYHCDLWEKNTEADIIEHFSKSGFQSILRNQEKDRGWIIAKKIV